MYVGPRIYHAGSIRGGRDNVDIFAAEREECMKFGDVLTRHIGDKKLTRYGEKGVSNYKIFKRDEEWLYSADVAIVDVTTPSIGVGREIQMAVDKDIKILCISKEQPNGRRLSPQVSGDPELPLRYYRDAKEARSIIYAFLTGSGYVTKKPEKERMFT